MNLKLILVTGATGYVGGRLVPRLLEAGYRVRVLVRDRSYIEGRWPDVEVVDGDAQDENVLKTALQGVDAAYYLIHSMISAGSSFESKDLAIASAFSKVASSCGVGRIIYLGGLAQGSEISSHLRSRIETGDALRRSGVPVTEFRAGMIIGSGSLSFEMLRYLTERLVVMICPRWVLNLTQPIAIRDVLQYLLLAIERPQTAGKIYEIGGADQLSFRDMMQRYARQRSLHRWIIPVPVLTPKLSALWVSFITPIPSSIARPLIGGIHSEILCKDDEAKKDFGIEVLGFDEAVRIALEKTSHGLIETVWVAAQKQRNHPSKALLLRFAEGFVVESRRQKVEAPQKVAFEVISQIGGDAGWPYAHFLWWIRGLLDWLIGGVGFRRGRRSPHELRVGDVLDFWRVEKFDPPSLLRLRAEMKVPGRAWLQFEVKELSSETSEIFQTAYFDPKGLFGVLYWYALYPLHGIIFGGMIRRLAQKSEQKFKQLSA